MEVAVGETSARVLTEPKPIVTEVCKNKEVTNAMKQSEKMCLSIFELEEAEIKETRNI